ncbi:MAG: hypothetical protein RMM17_00255 [Acidobacteriota bacterium]|nr:hypothetical protein [Blastocatellia bacterium]MDW8411097.1 hypothetical protein [Acidobacteriota bacterium]
MLAELGKSPKLAEQYAQEALKQVNSCNPEYWAPPFGNAASYTRQVHYDQGQYEKAIVSLKKQLKY